MFSRCPQCAKQHPVTVAHLRQQRGLLECLACGQSFDALRFLSEDTESASTDELGVPKYLVFDQRSSVGAVWLWGSGLALLLLALQIMYFEGHGLMMQPQIRERLDKICATIACELPGYQNLDELTVSHSDLLIQDGYTYVFNAAISNQALFAQQAPALKLTLLNFAGEAVAQRVFNPVHYLNGAISLAPAHTLEIRLAIVAPIAPVGGYTFILL